MKNKVERLNIIRETLIQERIGSQDELLKHLIEKGFDLTQATLSRDLKQLKIAKVPSSDGRYIYVLPEAAGIGKMIQGKIQPSSGFSVSGILSVDFSGNLVVMKTRPGYAGSVAYDIDMNSPVDILGTIAGDDTTLLILREGVDRVSVLATLNYIFPGLKV